MTMSEFKPKPANGTKAFISVLGFAAVFAPSQLRAEPNVTAATTAAVAPAATKSTLTAAATKSTITSTKKESGVTAPAAPSGTTAGIGDALGGHVGVAVPLVTFQGYTSSTYAAAPLDKTRTVDEQFNLAFPIGVTVKTSRRVAVDFEVTVVTQIHPTGSTQLTIDPGVIYDWGPVATGLRLAVPVGASPSAIGLIPLINRGITKIGGAMWFVEAAFPLLYHGSGLGAQPNGAQGMNSLVEFNMVLHTGFGF
jgi:hypothetical protein